jgi:hypothetical protein
MSGNLYAVGLSRFIFHFGAYAVVCVVGRANKFVFTWGPLVHLNFHDGLHARGGPFFQQTYVPSVRSSGTHTCTQRSAYAPGHKMLCENKLWNVDVGSGLSSARGRWYFGSHINDGRLNKTWWQQVEHALCMATGGRKRHSRAEWEREKNSKKFQDALVLLFLLSSRRSHSLTCARIGVGAAAVEMGKCRNCSSPARSPRVCSLWKGKGAAWWLRDR